MSQETEQKLLQTLDELNGYHAGFRPAHAKGVMLTGVFRPAADGAHLTKAPHLHRDITPVTARFSDFAGFPAVADNDPEHASPRGFALRFHLAEHVHTDIIGHSVDGFPVRTAEEFLQFLQALGASGPGVPKPTPIEAFLAAHPAALKFVQTPKPIPVSFAQESYFAVNAMRFVNAEGVSRFGRYRIRPDVGEAYLENGQLETKGPDFLAEDLEERLRSAPITMNVFVQLADRGDVVDDSTINWPPERTEARFGTVELNEIVPPENKNAKRIIFDPIPRVDGIEPSDDPLLDPRANIYLTSGRRRRAADPA